MNKPLLLGLGWGGSVMLLQCILKHCCGNGFILHDPRVIENRWSQQWWLHTDLDSKIFMREWQLRFAICHLGCQKIFHPVHRMWQAKSISVQSLVMPYIKTHQYIQMMGILCKKTSFAQRHFLWDNASILSLGAILNGSKWLISHKQSTSWKESTDEVDFSP